MADWEFSQLAVRSSPAAATDYLPVLVTTDHSTAPAGGGGSNQRSTIAAVQAAGLSATQTAVVYVSATGSDSNSGLSWNNACATVAHAIGLLGANGGTVEVGYGNFSTAAAIAAGVNGLRLRGQGPLATTLTQTSTSANGISVTSASALSNITIEQMTVSGPGSGTGIGILASANSGALRVERLTLSNVIVTGFGSHGAELDNTIMSRVDQCKFISNGDGLYLNGGTTARVSNTWFTGNTTGRGFYANAAINGTLIACGSDSNALGYELLSCTTMQLFACDVSGTVAAGGLDGTSIKVNACFGVMIVGAFISNNAAVGLWITAASGGCAAYGIIETAVGGATASIKTDSGTDLIIDGPDLATATAYALNTVSLLAGSFCFFADVEAGVLQVDTGSTLNGGVTVGAGSTSVAPLKLTSGTSLTSAAAGATEYDGTAFYDTSVASARQVRVTEQFQSLTTARTFANNTSAQAVFNATANGALTVAASTTYDFECILNVTGLSGSAHTVNFGFGGTATFTSAAYQALTATAAGGALSSFAVTSASATAITASNTGTVLQAVIRGTLRVNAGGTVIPQLTQVTASAAAVVAVNSEFRCWPKGSNTVTSVGNWS